MKMNKWFKVIFGILIFAGILSLVMSMSPAFRAWLDDKVYDNYDPYLPCEQWPTIAELDKVFTEHNEELSAIMRLSPNINIEREQRDCGGERHAIWKIFYSNHAERMQIEEALGGKEVFGQPAIWRNW